MTSCKFRVSPASNHECPYRRIRKIEKRKSNPCAERERLSDVWINHKLLRVGCLSPRHENLEKRHRADCFFFSDSRRN